jgi:hypothetical protein
MKEIWTPVYCNKNYLVSNKGRVKRLEHVSSKGYHLKEKMMKINTSSRYSRVQIQGFQALRIHQIVYYSFFGGKPDGLKYVIDHIDGDKNNNCLYNLQCISQYENTMKGKIKKYDLPKYISAFPCSYDNNKLMYIYQPWINGKKKILKKSICLDKVLAFKKKFEKTFNTKER